VLAIIIATLAEVSTGKMLIAGVIPGLLLSGMFIVYVLVRVYVNPALAPDVAAEIRDPATRGSALMAFVRMLPAGFIFFLVMGLIMLGVATPTEAAATGVFGALVLAWFYRGLTWKMLTGRSTRGSRWRRCYCSFRPHQVCSPSRARLGFCEVVQNKMEVGCRKAFRNLSCALHPLCVGQTGLAYSSPPTT
jgi:hypothetical protein